LTQPPRTAENRTPSSYQPVSLADGVVGTVAALNSVHGQVAVGWVVIGHRAVEAMVLPLRSAAFTRTR
jgi:hypothetical protein